MPARTPVVHQQGTSNPPYLQRPFWTSFSVSRCPGLFTLEWCKLSVRFSLTSPLLLYFSLAPACSGRAYGRTASVPRSHSACLQHKSKEPLTSFDVTLCANEDEMIQLAPWLSRRPLLIPKGLLCAMAYRSHCLSVCLPLLTCWQQEPLARELAGAPCRFPIAEPRTRDWSTPIIVAYHQLTYFVVSRWVSNAAVHPFFGSLAPLVLPLTGNEKECTLSEGCPSGVALLH